VAVFIHSTITNRDIYIAIVAKSHATTVVILIVLNGATKQTDFRRSINDGDVVHTNRDSVSRKAILWSSFIVQVALTFKFCAIDIKKTIVFKVGVGQDCLDTSFAVGTDRKVE